MRRAWRAFWFGIRAMRIYWRHPDNAQVMALPHGAQPIKAVADQSVKPTEKEKTEPMEALFYVQANNLEQYKGSDPVEAQVCIENLRRMGLNWKAYREGELWDWGPR